MSDEIVVVGLGADGWDGLPATSRRLVEEAQVVLGGTRHLALLPPLPAQDRVAWPSPLREALPGLVEEHAGRRVAVVASGDPLRSGIGTTLIGLLGADRVRVVPAVSSDTLARARMGWSAESCDVVSVVGSDLDRVRRHLLPGQRLVVLSADGGTPERLAALLVDAGHGGARMTVLGDLGAVTEARLDGVAADWPEGRCPELNVVCVACEPVPAALLLPLVGGLPDEAFEHDGQLTRRDLRASALSRLAPMPGALLWDVGAGAGSVGVEWARTDPRCRTVAVEQHPERAARVARNARRLGVPDLRVVQGAAPQALDGLERPDAVFVGGGATVPGLLEACWQRLRTGGRLVVHGVTLETESLLASWHADHGGELTRTGVELAAPLGDFTGWRPARSVVQWSVIR